MFAVGCERGRTTTMDADRLLAKTEGGSKDKPERAKPEPKEPAGPPGALSGEVKWYARKKGFGFIAPADGGEPLKVGDAAAGDDGFGLAFEVDGGDWVGLAGLLTLSAKGAEIRHRHSGEWVPIVI